MERARMRGVGTAAGLLACGLWAAAAAGVERSSECRLDDTTLSVLIVSGGEHVLARDADGYVTVDGARCGDATVTTVDRVLVARTYDPAASVTLRISLANGGLAPGATDEAGDSDEIEVQFVSSNALGGSARPNELVVD